MARCLLTLLASLLVGLAPLEGASVPRRSPEYAVKLTTGRQLLVSSYRGKVVALMFVSTDCPHCAETCQLMDGIQKEYGPRGLQTLAVAFNPMAMMLVPEFIQRAQATFPVGYDERNTALAYLEIPSNQQLWVPIMVFIDRNGTIRGQYLGDDKFFSDREKNIRGTLEMLLKEPAGAKKTAAKSSSGGE